MSVGQNINEIERLFMEISHSFKKDLSIAELIEKLDAVEPKFRSIGYESASYVLGDLDLQDKNDLKNWSKLYASADENHRFHMIIGLGWSIAKSGNSTLPITDWEDDRVFRSMVLDGMGYYYALYRPRRTLTKKIYPDWLMGDDLKAFDQGIGRRLWYLYHDNQTKLIEILSTLSEDRIPSLYTGLGIAFTYVSGFDEREVVSLKKMAGPNWKEMRKGFLIGSSSRAKKEYQLKELNNFIQSEFQQNIENLNIELTDYIEREEWKSDNSYWLDQVPMKNSN
ncbi:MAG: DUF1702 family protein [Bacteroidetes bacterium]|nr:MAG: DUF1702 family protein [Bacteroidota bacterium]